MSKVVYYFWIIGFAFGASYHSYIGNDIKLISDAIMLIGTCICLEIRNSGKDM